MIMKLIKVLILTVVLVLAGCYSLSTYQNADTVPEGKFAGGLGFSTLRTNTESDTDTASENDFLGNITLMELFMRYGITDNMDIGFKLYSTNLSIDWKWRILPRNSIIRIAPNLGAVYTNMWVTSGWGVFANLIIDIKPADFISIYFGPKYMYTHYDFTDEIDDFLPNHYYGGFFGLSFNFGKIHIRPEINVYKIAFKLADINADPGETIVYQPGIAISFGY